MAMRLGAGGRKGGAVTGCLRVLEAVLGALKQRSSVVWWRLLLWRRLTLRTGRPTRTGNPNGLTSQIQIQILGWLMSWLAILGTIRIMSRIWNIGNQLIRQL